jgi:hypothetical protein
MKILGIKESQKRKKENKKFIIWEGKKQKTSCILTVWYKFHTLLTRVRHSARAWLIN